MIHICKKSNTTAYVENIAMTCMPEMKGSKRPDATVENVRFINVRTADTDAAIVPVCQSHAISSYSAGNAMEVSSTRVHPTNGAILDGSDPPLNRGCCSATRAAASPSHSFMSRRCMSACMGLLVRLAMPWACTHRMNWARRTRPDGSASCWRLFRVGPANGHVSGCCRGLDTRL